MLGVAIDWAESFHDVALGQPGKGVIEQFRIDHTVVLETRHEVLVETLIDAGFAVLPVNSDLVARRRDPARKKDDAEDAIICCLMA